MSQHDYVIDNSAGSIFRSDLNGVLAAIVSQNSGASAPATTFAYMYWVDTATGWLKQRNSTNTSWVNLARLGSGASGRRPVSSRASNTILADADFGAMIRATAAFTQTLTAAATLGDGWWCSFRNDAASNCIIDPNASETIDGTTTININPGASIQIECSGSAFHTVSGAIAVDTGSIKPWPSASIPAGWFECDGSAINRTTYATLFALVGISFGPGDGSTTFNLPDLRGRAIIGTGQPPGGANHALAEFGGAETTYLSGANMPAHNHNLGAGVLALGGGGYQAGTASFAYTIKYATDSAGSGTPFAILNPYLALKWIIKT